MTCYRCQCLILPAFRTHTRGLCKCCEWYCDRGAPLIKPAVAIEHCAELED